jgi:hypothetical protein
VAADVFHAVVPAAITFEDSAAEATGAALRRFSLLDPAALTDRFETVLEGLPVCTRLWTGCEGARAGTRFGLMHASVVLGEKILAVEVIVNALMAWYTRVEFGVTGTNIAAIEA